MSASRSRSRREFLKSIGASAALIPLLDAEHAFASTPFPRRIIIACSPNGVLQDMYWPKGTETNWAFPDGTERIPAITKPLKPVQSDLIVMKGIDMPSTKDDRQVGYGNGHDNFPHLFTGMATVGGKQAGGPSLDQFLAQRLNPPTKIKALTLACMVQWGAIHQARISWAGAGRPVTPQEDPYKVFADLFAGAAVGGTPAQRAEIEKVFAAKQSVLDRVGKDLERFRQRLGTEDRTKLESHMSAIQDLHRTFDPKFANSATCAQPNVGSRIDVQRVANFPQVAKLQMDLMVEAMACDLTRIGTIQFANAAANHMVYSWLGKEYTEPAHKDGAGRGEFGELHNHHELSHRGSIYPHLKAGVERWYHEQFLYLINRLKSKREGAGTMLDNTIVLWTNNMNRGDNHTCGPNMPWLLAGRGGGYFKTGRFIDRTGSPVPHNRLLLTLAQSMGVQTDTFGDPKYCAGGALGELRG
jgi:hypothetical protein